jgi:hypothetical protein
MLRSLWGFVLAPFPIAFVQAIVVGLWPKPGMGVFEHPASMFVALCLYFYISGILIGIPTATLGRKHIAGGLRGYALLGLIVGLAPAGAAIVYLILQGQATAYTSTYNVLLFGLGGVIAGATYWFVAARKGRVDGLEATFS